MAFYNLFEAERKIFGYTKMNHLDRTSSGNTTTKLFDQENNKHIVQYIYSYQNDTNVRRSVKLCSLDVNQFMRKAIDNLCSEQKSPALLCSIQDNDLFERIFVQLNNVEKDDLINFLETLKIEEIYQAQEEGESCILVQNIEKFVNNLDLVKNNLENVLKLSKRNLSEYEKKDIKSIVGKYLNEVDPCNFKCNFKCGTLVPGGAKKSSTKLTRTNKKVSTAKGERTVYKGPRGGEYVRLDGKLVPVGKVSTVPKKDTKKSKKKPVAKKEKDSKKKAVKPAKKVSKNSR